MGCDAGNGRPIEGLGESGSPRKTRGHVPVTAANRISAQAKVNDKRESAQNGLTITNMTITAAVTPGISLIIRSALPESDQPLTGRSAGAL
jgi:hypothetical protein